MELYAGLDLHSRNTYIGIMDDAFNRVFKKRVPNDLDQILQILKPFKKRLKGFVVESTYNWYWLVDGLMDAGYGTAHLANPSAIKQYEGLKYSDDQHDAFFLAKLLILGILPEGYIYPKATSSGARPGSQTDVFSPAQDRQYFEPAVLHSTMLLRKNKYRWTFAI